MTADYPRRRSDGPERATDDGDAVDDGDGDDAGAGDEGVHTTNFRTGRYESPSEAVVEAVATATNRDPLALRSLHEVIDPDALDRLFWPTSGASGRPANGQVTFRYEGREVTVSADGATVVRPLPEADH